MTARSTSSGTRHYSYAHYDNPEIAAGFDALRFSGAVGTLLAETQARVLDSFLAPLAGTRVLDVGTGTGRGALVLARAGARVTGVDASAEMLAVARRRAEQSGTPVEFQQGDAHRLPFPDASFDAAVSLRVIMHTPDWRQCVAELCRVSRRRVVLDYPAAISAAALQAAGRHVAARMGRRTEPYRVFTDRAIRDALARHGFHIVGTHRQFVLPIALHKLADSRRSTIAVERALAAVGLLRWLGSPVTVVAER
ncbi:MAG TPA: class I SAM-dependent methyltransferase [Vicinamibacterales bacterium]|nr:class I SAM-dependent methyltransferase [Vicinamibacterales bacterium]